MVKISSTLQFKFFSFSFHFRVLQKITCQWKIIEIGEIWTLIYWTRFFDASTQREDFIGKKNEKRWKITSKWPNLTVFFGILHFKTYFLSSDTYHYSTKTYSRVRNFGNNHTFKQWASKKKKTIHLLQPGWHLRWGYYQRICGKRWKKSFLCE